MVFSSISFLFFFLPLLFITYFVVPKKYRNAVLLLFSLLFYFFGEKWYVFLLIASCLINYILGRIIEQRRGKFWLSIGIVLNLGCLIYFKYTNFFIESFMNAFNLHFSLLNVVLPLGISFFTFQNVSYLVDVYRGEVESQKNFVSYATYITLFAQLVAGPIVRYKDVAREMDERVESAQMFASGIDRFVIGLAKKVVIADVLYSFYKGILDTSMVTVSYWVGAIVYTLHIYYDFSGYSDMAIGLGRMCGFNFKENFDYPLWANSITDFWHRWHMSLSSFFRDYVYIPLGGSRVSRWKHIRNIFVVWILTGLWHGAAWNFVLWGLYFFVFLIIEKFFLKKYLKGGVGSHLYAFLIVLVSFVIFQATSLADIGNYIKGMLGGSGEFVNREFLLLLKDNLVLLLVAIIGSGPLLKKILEKLKEGKMVRLVESAKVMATVGLFVLSIAKILGSSFQPFIYFRF